MPQPVRRNLANDDIVAPTVRLIAEDGRCLGVVSLAEARTEAARRDLDLVEVAPTSSPPVCKITDLGQLRYQQSKRARPSSHHRPKTVKFHLRISEHDRLLKLDHVRQFLTQGFQVVLVVELKGRERTNPARADEFLGALLDELGHVTDRRSSAPARATAWLTPHRRAA